MEASGENPDLIPGLLDESELPEASAANDSEALIRPAVETATSVLVPMEQSSVFEQPAIYVAICIIFIAAACVLIALTRWHANRKPTRDRAISTFEQVSTYL